MTDNAWTIKNVKTFKGHDGEGFNAILCRNGKKVAEVIDLADGGEYQFTWFDWNASKVSINSINFAGEQCIYDGTPEQKLFIEFITKQKYFMWEKWNVHSQETWVGDLVENALLIKTIRQKIRYSIVYRTKDSEPQTFHLIKNCDANYVRKQNGDKLIMIFNETPEERWMEAFENDKEEEGASAP